MSDVPPRNKGVSDKQSCLGCLFILAVIVLIGLAVVSCSSSDTSTKNNSDKQPVAEETTTTIPTKTEYNLGFTSDQLVAKFNTSARDNNLELKIQNTKTTEKETYREMLCLITDNIMISSSINKSDNTVRNLVMVAKGDGTQESGLDIMACMLNIIIVADPSLSPQERGGILKALNISQEMPDQSTAEVTRGKIRYNFGISQDIGIFFSAMDARDRK